MSIYERNLRFLKNKAPVLYEQAFKSEPLYGERLVYDELFKQHKLQINGKSILLNSAYDKEREFYELFKGLDEELEVLVLLGIGDGSVFEYLQASNRKLNHLIIIEPYLEVMKLFLEHYRIEEVFQMFDNISIIVNRSPEDSVNLTFDLLNNRYIKVNFVSQLAYFYADSLYFSEVFSAMKTTFRGKLSQLITLYASSGKWLLNSVYNVRNMQYQKEVFDKRFEGKPAIIVSAGPSLNKHLELLSEIQDNALILAAGSACKILSAHDIKPHFRMAIDADGDPDLYDAKFYEESIDIPLLYANQLNYNVLREYKGDKYLMVLPTDLMGIQFYKKQKLEGSFVLSGASVVHSALSFLEQAGCDPIILIGQDMCFYNNDLYASGRSTGAMSGYHPSQLVETVDIYGNKVFSLRNYVQIKYDYEGIIGHMKCTVLNATEGGLGIKGAENVSFEATIQKYCQKKLDISINPGEEEKAKYKIDMKEIEFFFDEIIEDCCKIVGVLEERREKLLKLEHNDFETLNKRLKKLQVLDTDYEKKLSKISYYDQVVRSSIAPQVQAIKNQMAFSMDKNSKQYLMAGLKYLHMISTEAELYAELTREWIVDSKEDNGDE